MISIRPSRPSEKCFFDLLPTELKYKIFGELDTMTLALSMRVSKTWKCVIERMLFPHHDGSSATKILQILCPSKGETLSQSSVEMEEEAAMEPAGEKVAQCGDFIKFISGRVLRILRPSKSEELPQSSVETEEEAAMEPEGEKVAQFGDFLKFISGAPIELKPLLRPLLVLISGEGDSTSVAKLALNLVVDFLHRSQTLEKTLSLLDQEEKFQCLVLYLESFSEELETCLNNIVLHSWYDSSKPSALHMLFYLVYHGLLSERFGSQTIKKICEHTEKTQKESTVLLIFYSLFSYLSQKKETLGEEQSKKLYGQIRVLFDRLSSQHSYLVSCEAKSFMESCCPGIDIVASSTNRTEATKEAMFNMPSLSDLGEDLRRSLVQYIADKSLSSDEDVRNGFDMRLAGCSIDASKIWNIILDLVNQESCQNGFILFDSKERNRVATFVDRLMLKFPWWKDGTLNEALACIEHLLKSPRKFSQIFLLLNNLIFQNKLQLVHRELLNRFIEAFVMQEEVQDVWYIYVGTCISEGFQCRVYLDLVLQLFSHRELFSGGSYRKLFETLGKEKTMLCMYLLLSSDTFSAETFLGYVLDYLFEFVWYGGSSSLDFLREDVRATYDWIDACVNQPSESECRQNLVQEKIKRYMSSLLPVGVITNGIVVSYFCKSMRRFITICAIFFIKSEDQNQILTTIFWQVGCLLTKTQEYLEEKKVERLKNAITTSESDDLVKVEELEAKLEEEVTELKRLKAELNDFFRSRGTGSKVVRRSNRVGKT